MLLYRSLKTIASAPVRQAGPNRPYRREESARSCSAGAVARPTLARQARSMALLSGWRGLSPVRRLRQRRGALRQDMDSSKRAVRLVVLARCSALDPPRRPTRWTPGRSSLLEALQRPQTMAAGSGANDRLQRQRTLFRRLAASTVLQSSWAYLHRRDLQKARALLRSSAEADGATFANQRKGVFDVFRGGAVETLGWKRLVWTRKRNQVRLPVRSSLPSRRRSARQATSVSEAAIDPGQTKPLDRPQPSACCALQDR